MINKIITLFKIARKLAQSDAIKIIEKFHEPPKIIKIFSYLLSFSFSGSNKLVDKNLNEEFVYHKVITRFLFSEQCLRATKNLL